MALPQEIMDLIKIFRKETEDVVHANLVEVFMIKYGEAELEPGDNLISLPGDEAYDSEMDYVVGFYEAIDSEGIDVRGELTVKDQTLSGFTVNAYRKTYIKWVTSRKVPKINFWTTL